jgi:hypothetical protein
VQLARAVVQAWLLGKPIPLRERTKKYLLKSGVRYHHTPSFRFDGKDLAIERIQDCTLILDWNETPSPARAAPIGNARANTLRDALNRF